ncbi:MAG: CocE/NonD family hydrolase [Chthoniobacterales bacterium]
MKTTAAITIFCLLCLASASPAQEGRRRQHRGNRPPSTGPVYGKADDGTPLRWTVYPGAGPGPHPAVLVIHGGGFRREPNSQKTVRAAQDAAAAGFNAFLVEYRLASQRGLPGQTSSGRYPDQTNDLKIAVRAARKYPGGNGKVGAIGGSAGASHAVYLAATGTPGDDRLDAAVALSGAYDFNDLAAQDRPGVRKIVASYVGSSDPAALKKASPITYIDKQTAPLYVIASDHEQMPPQQYTDLITKLEAVGDTDFRKLLRTDSHAHAFVNWPVVRERCLAFLKEKLEGNSAAAASGATP